jgi:uncharacterized protein (TIGR02118 family)
LCRQAIDTDNDNFTGAAMIRVSVFYPGGTDVQFDHEYYTTTHRNLVQTRLHGFGLSRIDMERGMSDATGAAPAYVAIGQLTFATLEGFQKGWTAHGDEIVADIPLFTNKQPLVQISEVLGS